MMKKTSKMYASGGRMKSKGYAKGGKTDKLEMVEKDGKMVPFFAADGEGKMKAGGMVPNTKGYFKGGRAMFNQPQPKGLRRRGDRSPPRVARPGKG